MSHKSSQWEPQRYMWVAGQINGQTDTHDKGKRCFRDYATSLCTRQVNFKDILHFSTISLEWYHQY